jgi:hypothetical protein
LTEKNKTTPILRLFTVAAVLALALALGGCSLTGRTVLKNVSQDELSAGGEPYFNVGPLTYQVQVSRELDPYSNQDVQYLAGVQGAQQLPGDELWYGVFLWAKNQTNQYQTTTDTFKLLTSDGTVYTPTTLNPAVNAYAWNSEQLAPDNTQPKPNTTASFGPEGGGLILFKVSDSVYSNRPLTLEIYAPGSSTPSKVSLDL